MIEISASMLAAIVFPWTLIATSLGAVIGYIAGKNKRG